MPPIVQTLGCLDDWNVSAGTAKPEQKRLQSGPAALAQWDACHMAKLQGAEFATDRLNWGWFISHG